MYLPAVGGDNFTEMFKRYLIGEETGKARQQATGNGLVTVLIQNGEKYPRRVAKYHDHCHD
jgi:hypothetical protein